MGTKIAFVDECHLGQPEWWGYGAALLPAEQACRFQEEAESIKTQEGFPRRRPSSNERFSLEEYREFKFNPGKKNWMKDGLDPGRRLQVASKFFELFQELGGGIILSICEAGNFLNEGEARRYAQENLVERIKKHIETLESPQVALLVLDRSGSRNVDDQHTRGARHVLQWGTWYEKDLTKYIYAPVIPVESHHHVGVQIADWAVGVALRAAVCQDDFARQAWPAVMSALQACGGRHWGRSFKVRGDRGELIRIRKRLSL